MHIGFIAVLLGIFSWEGVIASTSVVREIQNTEEVLNADNSTKKACLLFGLKKANCYINPLQGLWKTIQYYHSKKAQEAYLSLDINPAHSYKRYDLLMKLLPAHYDDEEHIQG